MTLRVDHALSGSLGARSNGRIVVIDAYRSWTCGVWIGDLTASWSDRIPGADFVSTSLEGVHVAVRQTLVDLLTTAGASLAARILSRDGSASSRESESS